MSEPSLLWKFATDLSSQGVAALVGAYAGARLAFHFERKRSEEDRALQEAREQKRERDRDAREEKRERDREALAGRIAMFTLARMYNTLVDFYSQRIKPWRTDPLLWYFMPPGGEPSLEGHFDYAALAFLLKSESPMIVLRLDRQADIIRTLADMVRRRSFLHETEILPKLERITIVPGTPVQNIETYLGARLITTAQSYTGDIRALVYEGLQELPKLAQDLHALLKRRMPEENFILFNRVLDENLNPLHERTAEPG